MNARRRLQREIIRRRRRAFWPEEFTRVITPNGTPVCVILVRTSCALHNRHAEYWTSGGLTYTSWPPTPELLRELGRWA